MSKMANKDEQTYTLDDLIRLTGLKKTTIVSRLNKHNIKSLYTTGHRHTKTAFYPEKTLEIINYPFLPKNRKKGDGTKKQYSSYRVNVGYRGKIYYLGRFKSLQTAEEVKKTALREVKNRTFLEWHAANYLTHGEAKQNGLVSYVEAEQITGLPLSKIYYYMKVLKVKKTRIKTNIYISMESANAIKERYHEEKKSKEVKKKSLFSRNKLGVKGVTYKANRYRANINVNRKIYYLGSFKTLEDAKAAMEEAQNAKSEFLEKGKSASFSDWYDMRYKIYASKKLEGYITREEAMKLTGLSYGSLNKWLRELNIKTNGKNKNYITKDTAQELMRVRKENKKKLRVSNKTGAAGVSFSKRLGKYQVYIKVDGKRFYLGSFKDLNDALKAKQEGEAKYN